MPKKAKKYTNNVNTNAELNLIKKAFTGILSDTVPMITPSLIPSLDRLDDILVSAIAKKKPIQADDGTWTLVPNEDDPSPAEWSVHRAHSGRGKYSPRG